MPKQVELKVVVGERSGGVHIGDVMTIGSVTGEVVRIEEKSVWCFFHLKENGPDYSVVRRKLPMDSEVKVTREMLDDEESALFDLARVAAEARKDFTAARDNLKSAVRKMTMGIDRRAKDGDWFDAFHLDDAGDVAMSQARYNLYKSVEANAMSGIEAGIDQDVAWVGALVTVSSQCTQHLLRGWRSPLSRSTSLLSNLSDDIKDAAMAHFLDNNKWDKPEEVLRAAAEQGVTA